MKANRKTSLVFNHIALACGLSILLMVGCQSSCTSKPAVPSTPFTPAVRATDDIASAIKLLVAAESNVEQQKLITPQEGLAIIGGLSAINRANVQFTADLQAAIASGNKSALHPSLTALKNAVNELNNGGLLGLKSDKAKQVFSISMSTITLALGVLEGFVQ